MFDSVLSFIPKLFAAAVILDFMGIFIDGFVKNLVYNLLNTLKYDSGLLNHKVLKSC